MTTIECLKLVSTAPRLQLPYPVLGTGTTEPRMVETPRSEPLPSEDAGIRAPERLRSGFGCERETIRRAQLGDAMAWEILVRRNVGWILRTCGQWAGSRARAEELTQDVFVRVFQTLHSYRGELAGFRIWLSRITRNLLIDDYRKNRKERSTVSYDSADERTRHVFSSVPSSGSSPEAGIERQERRAALRRGLRLLGSELREAVILRDVEGLTYQEISQLLMMPVGTVKSRVNRGRIELARLLRQGATLPHDFVPNASAVA
jgi:RNA polymerase sigma-70 factor (ECF subfamily)